MIYSPGFQQWLCETIDDGHLLGGALALALQRKSIKKISSGTILVYTRYGKPFLYFQLMGDTILDGLYSSALLYYEPGSLVFTEKSYSGKTPTLLFGSCRLPYKSEALSYFKEITV